MPWWRVTGCHGGELREKKHCIVEVYGRISVALKVEVYGRISVALKVEVYGMFLCDGKGGGLQDDGKRTQRWRFTGCFCATGKVEVYRMMAKERKGGGLRDDHR
jgi:hypothetical protein